MIGDGRRNDYNPRIAVTVDMIATGTDVKPIEALIFLRDVKSELYFEQMKGRGARIITPTALRQVTPDAAVLRMKDGAVPLPRLGQPIIWL